MVRFTPQQVLQRQMVVYPVVAAVVIVALWIFWLIAPESAAGHGLTDMPASVRLYLAVIGTLLTPIGLAFTLFKTWMLISRGKPTEGRLNKFGSATSKGRQAVTFHYAVGGQTLTVTQSVAVDVAEQYTMGMKAPIIYDSGKPSRAQVFPNSNPQIDTSGPSAGQAVAQIAGGMAFEAIAAALFIIQWVLAIIVLHLINDQYDIGVFGPASLAVVALTASELYLYDRWTNKATSAYEARFRFAKRLLLPLAVLSVLWTGWAMNSESQRFAQDLANAKQAESDRVEAGKAQRDAAASMQTLQDAINRRNAARSGTTPKP